MKKKRIGIRLKTMSLIIIMGIVLGVLLISLTRKVLMDMVQNSYNEKIMAICTNAAETVDGDKTKRLWDKTWEVYESIPPEKWVVSEEWGTPEFEEFLSNFTFLEETQEYKDLYVQMSRLLEINDVEDIYISHWDNSVQFAAVYLVDPAPGEDQCRIGTFDAANPDPEILAHPENGMPPYMTEYADYGWLATGGVPVFTSDGEFAAFVAVDISMNKVMDRINSFLLQLALFVVLITAGIVVLYLIVIDRVVIRPVKLLAQSAKGYLKENTETEKHSFSGLPINSRDEIGDLYSAIQTMENNLNTHINSVMAMTAEKERLSAEMNVANRIQENMLPKDFGAFSELTGVDVYGTMIPAREVGGDFYDYFRIDRDHLGLVMADVSGKGVAAALFMAITKTFILSRTMMGGKPEEILTDTNKWLCQNNKEGFFVTVWLGIYEISSGEIRYVNAGHEYPLRNSSAGAFILRTENDPPLGTDEDIEFHGGRMLLGRGELLALYTDGIPEAKNAEGKRYGMDRMKNAMEGKVRAEEAVESLKEDLDSFVGGAEPFDDVTMLCLVRRG
ncbi:MAG: SpoIIE family protein phosphatase [Lachnospiraceae bacterium]|nr:SpoIIE family protein phosphatase [Lachnospiraceae bacterium]